MTSLVTSLTRTPAGGGQQFPQIEPVPWYVFSSAAVYSSANAAILVSVRVSVAVKISAIDYFVGTASGNVDVGIYTYDGTTHTRVASSGSTAAAGSSAIQSVALTAAYTLVPGITYYFAIAADNTTITMSRIIPHTGMASNRVRAVTKGSSFPLPATITTPGAASYVPFLAGA